MNVVSCWLERFQGPGFEKRGQLDYALANVEMATSTANTVHYFVAGAVSAVVYCDTPVSASRVDESAFGSHPGVSGVSPVRWKFVAVRLRHFPSIHSRTSATVFVCC